MADDFDVVELIRMSCLKNHNKEAYHELRRKYKDVPHERYQACADEYERLSAAGARFAAHDPIFKARIVTLGKRLFGMFADGSVPSREAVEKIWEESKRVLADVEDAGRN